LERSTFKPPQEELRLHFAIASPNGEEVAQMDGTARLLDPTTNQPLLGPDKQPIQGIGAGLWIIDKDLKGGEYTLIVSEASNKFPPEKRKFVVNRYEKPRMKKELEFTRKSYAASDDVVAACKVSPAEGGQVLANRPVEATVNIDGKQYGPDGKESDAPMKARTNAEGGVAVRFKLPGEIDRGDASLAVRFTDGANVETIVRPIPIVVKKFHVQLFPEGGDLVAGVPNRIYFQARTTLDKPAELTGRLVDQDGKEVAKFETLHDDKEPGANQGMGVFAFTPVEGQKYELKIDRPAGIKAEYAFPEIKGDGVVLSTLQGVTSDKDPIRASIRSAKKDRTLLIGAYCRGKLIATKSVAVKAGVESVVELMPAGGMGGVYRITVFEERSSNQFVPLAERLIYRNPAEKLNLMLETLRAKYMPGEKAKLAIQAADENGESAPAILMVAVVDKNLLTLADEKTHRLMPTHFLLTNEVRKPEDLEHTDFLLGKHPKAALAVDLLLGTQGWRRFAEQNFEKFHEQYQEDAERYLVSIGQTPLEANNYDAVANAASVRWQIDANKRRDDFVEKDAKLRRELLQANVDYTRAKADGDAQIQGMTVILQQADRDRRIAANNLSAYNQTWRVIAIAIGGGLLLAIGLGCLLRGLALQAREAAWSYRLAGGCLAVLAVGLIWIGQGGLQPFRTVHSDDMQFSALEAKQDPASEEERLAKEHLLVLDQVAQAPVEEASRPLDDLNRAFDAHLGAFKRADEGKGGAGFGLDADARDGAAQRRGAAGALALAPLLPAEPQQAALEGMRPERAKLQNQFYAQLAEDAPQAKERLRDLGQLNGAADRAKDLDGKKRAPGDARAKDDNQKLRAQLQDLEKKDNKRDNNGPMDQRRGQVLAKQEAPKGEKKPTAPQLDDKAQQKGDMKPRAPQLDKAVAAGKPVGAGAGMMPPGNGAQGGVAGPAAGGMPGGAGGGRGLPLGRPPGIAGGPGMPGGGGGAGGGFAPPDRFGGLHREAELATGGWGYRRRLEAVPPPPPCVVRQYAHHRSLGASDVRRDFTETLYWHPALVLPSGKTTVEFDLCDSLTTFQVLAYGHTLDGRIGAATFNFESRLPFSVEPKIPLEVTATDKIDLPVTIANDTDEKRQVGLDLLVKGLAFDGKSHQQLDLAANQRLRRVFRLQPNLVDGEAELHLDGRAGPVVGDSIDRKIKVVPDGFPVVGAKSDVLEKVAAHDIVMPDTWIPGTLKMQVQVYPSTLAELQQGLAGLLREPNGCFEQTSSSNYPNVLILNYLKETDQAKPDVARRAGDMVDRGYQKLISFECQNTAKKAREGYEWFGGAAPPHEALTAYGLMEFRDMAAVYPVDKAMVERTRAYLLSCRDGQGGFKRNPRALDSFGRAPEDITNAYIVWGLSEGSDDDLSKELMALKMKAKNSDDPYFLSLVANALLNRNMAEDALALLKKVAEKQQKDGHLEAAATSITGSGGRDLQIETTSLALLGWLKANRPADFVQNIQSAIKWIGQQRGGYGGFGSTQSTILALKALIAFTKANKKTADAGELVLKAGDNELGRLKFAAGVQEPLTIAVQENIAAKQTFPLHAGKNAVRVEITGNNVLPYTLTWTYQTLKPVSAEGCPVKLETKLDKNVADEGDAVRLNVKLQNISGKGQGMAVAIIGLPAGLTLPEDFKQLKDYTRLQDNDTKPGRISAWETNGRELVLYWRDLAPNAVMEVPIDLICRVPGEYRGPASRGYLYYNADLKHWVEPLSVTIKAKE
jgi:hypothetical protein